MNDNKDTSQLFYFPTLLNHSNDSQEQVNYSTNIPNHNHNNINTNSNCNTNSNTNTTNSNNIIEDTNIEINKKLPKSINILVLCNKLYQNAPFLISSGMKINTWNHFMNSIEFIKLLTLTYNLMSTCIGNNGTIYLNQLYDNINNIHYMKEFSDCITFFYINRMKNHCIKLLLDNLPEILTYLSIHSLQLSYSKHFRTISSYRFHDIFLSFFIEYFTGYKPYNIRYQCEWIYHDAIETSILVVGGNNNTYIDINNQSNIIDEENINNQYHQLLIQSMKQYTKSKYSFNNSPLITRFLQNNKNISKEELPSITKSLTSSNSSLDKSIKRSYFFPDIESESHKNKNIPSITKNTTNFIHRNINSIPKKSPWNINLKLTSNYNTIQEDKAIRAGDLIHQNMINKNYYKSKVLSHVIKQSIHHKDEIMNQFHKNMNINDKIHLQTLKQCSIIDKTLYKSNN